MLVIFLFFIVFGLWYLSEVLVPLFIGLFLAYLLDPVVDKLEKRKLGRGTATTIVLLIFSLVVFFLSFLIIPILLEQTKEFLKLFPNLISELEKFVNIGIKIFQKNILNFQTTDFVLSFKDNLSKVVDKLFQNIISSSMALFNFLGLVVITPIVTWYMLKDWDKMVKYMENQTPKIYKKKVKNIFKEVDSILSTYFRGQFLVSSSLVLYFSISFTIVGLKYSIFMGLFAGLFSFIPIIGIIISLVISLLLAFLQFYDYTHLLYVIGIFFFAQILESYILTPRLIGKKLGIHPLVIIISIIIFGSILGMVGVFFAIPFTSIIIFYFEKWIKNIGA
tara:strand:+ start:1 stop:1002 length:1002 start_codon:yes stop_codon:yes gene_type:complete